MNEITEAYTCSTLPLITLTQTNIAPEDGWLEYYFPFGMAYFQVLSWFQGG